MFFRDLLFSGPRSYPCYFVFSRTPASARWYLLMKAFFPVQCTDTLLRIALLVKQTRLQQGIRQVDLAERLGISLRTFRRIEAGNAEGVSLRDFMLVVWGLGVSERLFQGLRDDESFSVEQLEAADRKRVRLPRHKPEDF